jgi:hypothetical protein
MSGLAKLRRLTLFAFLAVMIYAIVYDYRIARPAVAAAYDQITTESRRLNSQAGSTFSNVDVQKLLGKTPSDEFTEGTHFIEAYDFPAGIPGRPHRLYAVFKQNGSQKLFYRHAKFAYETGKEVAPFPENEVLEISEEGAELMQKLGEAEFEQEARMGLYGPHEMFKALDANADGQLQRDEMVQGLREASKARDENNDGVLSRAEFDALYADWNSPSPNTNDTDAGEPSESELSQQLLK